VLTCATSYLLYYLDLWNAIKHKYKYKGINLWPWQEVYVCAEVAHGAREHRLICGSEGHVSSFMLVVTEEIKTWNGCVV